MSKAMRAVDLSFFDNAPVRLSESVDLPASPAEVFAILEDGDSWPRWFDAISKVTWTSPEPKGLGTTRTVELGRTVVDEVFIAWEPGLRFAFYLSASTSSLFAALAEDYRIEDLGAGRCRYTHVFVYEPRWLLRLAGPLGKMGVRDMIKKATKGLAAYVDNRA